MKKLISIVLALLMVVSIVPMFAFSISADTATTTVNGGVQADSADFLYGAQTALIEASVTKYTNAIAAGDTSFNISTPYDLLAYNQMIVNDKFNANDHCYGTFNLVNDIVLNSSANTNWLGASSDSTKVTVWTSKGVNNHTSFNGNGYSISGIYTKPADSTDVGLFGRLHTPDPNTIRFENVAIVDSYAVLPAYSISNNNITFGCIWGNILNAKGVNISQVYLDIDVTPSATTKTDAFSVGGMIGWMRSPGEVTISSSVVAGDIYAGHLKRVGGFLGWIQGSSSNAGGVTINNSAFYGAIDSIEDTSSFVARMDTFYENSTTQFSLKVSNSISAPAKVSNSVKNYAFYGRARNSSNVNIPTVEANTSYITNCLYTDQYNQITIPTNFNITTNNIIAADLEGTRAATTLAKYGLSDWAAVAGSKVYPTYIANKFASEIANTETNLLATGDYDWYIDKSLSEFTLSTASELLGFATLIANGNALTNKTVNLANDITVNEDMSADNLIAWANTSDRDFFGTFDGNGHTLSGLYANVTVAGFGFFGACRGGKTTIKDLAIVNSRIDITSTQNGNNNSGAIIGSAINGFNVTLENLYVDVDMMSGLAHNAGKSAVGGLVGFARQGTLNITNCVVAGTVEGKGNWNAGGFLGQTAGTGEAAKAATNVNISDSAFYGTVSNINTTADRQERAGAFIGSFANGTLTLDNCVSAPETAINAEVVGAYIGWLKDANASQVQSYTITESVHTEDKTVAGESVEVGAKEAAGSLVGNGASLVLQLRRFDGWVTVDGEKALPASVAELLGKTGTAVTLTNETRFAGLQLSKTAGENGYQIRFIGVLDDYTDYTALGFKMTSTARTEAIERNCIYVYDSLCAMENETVEEYTAADFNGKYLFAAVVDGFGATEKLDITITTYHKDANGNLIDDTTYTFTIDVAALIEASN